MPIQAPQWTEFLSCPVCCHKFDGESREPISLGCGHTVCRGCLGELKRKQCPYDQTQIQLDLDKLPVNAALLSLINESDPNSRNHHEDLSDVQPPSCIPAQETTNYLVAVQCLKELALLLKPISNFMMNGSVVPVLSRPMQRKLVTLINCQLVEEEGRARALRAARSLGERTVMELILHHQNHHQLSANLWAAVRSRGCQFLGPAMQEEVLKLVLLALEDGSSLSRKVLVMFVVQRLEPHFPQASKTSIGHVVQLLYRASCFKVSKRDCDSSLMQLKEEFRTYESLRREHDAQIVQIATEAGLRIAPDQWSSLLYGDTARKSHMQSIIDKLQSPQAFGQSVQELIIALQRTGDPGQLSTLRQDFELLANTDPSVDAPIPDWKLCADVIKAVQGVVKGLVQFVQDHGSRKNFEHHHLHEAKYKTSLCRDFLHRGTCPRNHDCTFAHSEDELERFRCKARKHGKTSTHHSSNAAQALTMKSQVDNSSESDYNSYYSLPSPNMVNPMFKNAPNSAVPMILGEMVQFVPKSQPLINSNIPSNSILKHGHHTTQQHVYAASNSEYQYPVASRPNNSSRHQEHPMQTVSKCSEPTMYPQQNASHFHDVYPQHFMNQPSYLMSRNEFSSPVSTSKHSKQFTSPVTSSWSNENKEWPVGRTDTDAQIMEDICDDVVTEGASEKSLSQLRHRKDRILSQLQTLVGEEEMNEVASKVEKGEIVSADSGNYFTDYSSIYNIWTTGANLSNFSWKKSLSKVLEPSEPAHIELLPPNHFGLAEPIHVSGAEAESVTIPSSHKPLSAISPIQQVLYKPGAFTVGLVSYPPKVEYLNTVGHGILDPSHLHMSQLEPLGIRPSDPVSEPINVDREESQRLHLIAAKQGIDTTQIEEKLQELLLKEELNQVVQQIWEKEKIEDDVLEEC